MSAVRNQPVRVPATTTATTRMMGLARETLKAWRSGEKISPRRGRGAGPCADEATRARLTMSCVCLWVTW